jgi:hypothetical protein
MALLQLIREGVKSWHGTKLNQPDWSDRSHSIALSVELPQEALLADFIFNASVATNSLAALSLDRVVTTSRSSQEPTTSETSLEKCNYSGLDLGKESYSGRGGVFS